SPGVYIFADKEKKPLYIGKSINLKSRIAQHLEMGVFPDSKPAHFIPQTNHLILQTVDSDIAAIILEANLIKTYQPYYNAATKDDKTVSYIVISNSPLYSFKVLHRSDLKLKDYHSPDTQIYGPYPSAVIANIVLKQVRRIFGFCQNPAIQKSCFYFHISQCPGPCVGKISPAEYAKHLTKIKSFLSGRFLYLIESLKKDINAAAKKETFEKAQKLKHELEALQIALTSRQYKQLLVLPAAGEKVLKQMVFLLKHPKLKRSPRRIECYDMATLNQQNTVGAMVVLTNGQEDRQAYRKFLVKTNKLGDPHTMKHIMERRLRHSEWGKPDLMVLDGGIPQLSIVSQVIPPNIPVIALSKKRETIHFYGEDGKVVNLNLPLHNSVLRLLQHIRDEAHRTATIYHKLRRQKAILNL
ncbi:GIY-YIG nuclease family protein, partial [Candidatus Collierbacteria bacterium]|nr:GIY-YIG nuclease family protein [Candidatus Collierbacteria bacterium]